MLAGRRRRSRRTILALFEAQDLALFEDGKTDSCQAPVLLHVCLLKDQMLDACIEPHVLLGVRRGTLIDVGRQRKLKCAARDQVDACCLVAFIVEDLAIRQVQRRQKEQQLLELPLGHAGENSELLQEVGPHVEVLLDRLFNNARVGFVAKAQQLCVLVETNRGRGPCFGLDQNDFAKDVLRADDFHLFEHPDVVQPCVGQLFRVPDGAVDLLLELGAAVGLLPDHIFVTVDECLLGDSVDEPRRFDAHSAFDHDERLHVFGVRRVVRRAHAAICVDGLAPARDRLEPELLDQVEDCSLADDLGVANSYEEVAVPQVLLNLLVVVESPVPEHLVENEFDLVWVDFALVTLEVPNLGSQDVQLHITIVD